MSKREFPIPKFCAGRQWPGDHRWIVRTRNPLLPARVGKPTALGTSLSLWPHCAVPEKRLENFVQWCGEVLHEGFEKTEWVEDGFSIPPFLMMRAVTGADWEGMLEPRTGKIWQIAPRRKSVSEGGPLVLLPEFDNAAPDYYAEFWKRAEARNSERLAQEWV